MILVTLGAAYLVILGVVIWTLEVTQSYIYGSILRRQGLRRGHSRQVFGGDGLSVSDWFELATARIGFTTPIYHPVGRTELVFNVAALLTVNAALSGLKHPSALW